MNPDLGPGSIARTGLQFVLDRWLEKVAAGRNEMALMEQLWEGDIEILHGLITVECVEALGCSEVICYGMWLGSKNFKIQDYIFLANKDRKEGEENENKMV